MNRLFVLSFICLILGCAGASIGYGGTFQVSYSDENMIMFTYDSDLTNIKKMMPTAIEHCAKYNKKVVPQPPSAPNWNAVSTFTCNCEEK